jgi:hypothetical protein
MFTQKFRFVLATGILALSTGCGSQSKPAAMVTGAVTLNGEPFNGASVHFYNPEIGGAAFNLNDNGYFSSQQPIVVAEYMVALDRPGPDTGETPADTAWPEDRSGDIPAMYRSSSKSGLIARVSTGTENYFSFDIKGQPSKKKGEAGPVAFDPLPGAGS